MTSQIPPRLRKIVLLATLTTVAVLLPVIAACSIFYIERRGESHQERGSRDGLVASPAIIMLTADSKSGEGTRKQVATVSLRNVSGATLHILGTSVACGCTAVEGPSPATLEPGAAAHLTVAAELPPFGDKNTYVEVSTDHADRPVLRIPVVLKGHPLRVPYITSRPVPMRLAASGADAASPREFQVQTVEAAGTPRWVASIVPRASLVRIMEGGVSEASGPAAGTVTRTYRYKVVAATDAPPTGGAYDELEIQLTRPSDLPVSSIPVKVMSAPRVRVIPDSLFLTERDDIPAERLLLVIADPAADGFSAAAEPGSLPEWISVDTQTLSAGAADGSRDSATRVGTKVVRRIRVRVTKRPTDADESTGMATASLVIATSDHRYPRLVVPVVVATEASRVKVSRQQPPNR